MHPVGSDKPSVGRVVGLYLGLAVTWSLGLGLFLSGAEVEAPVGVALVVYAVGFVVGSAAFVAIVLRRRDRAAEVALDRQKHTIDQLAATLKELEDIKYALDQSSIVATTDRSGRITYANDYFCAISKYSREELLGQDHRILNSGYHSKEFIAGLWNTIREGRVWKDEIRNRAKDGSVYWVDTTIVPFLDASGRPYQYLAIRNDITERKRAEEALHRQAALAHLGRMAAVVAHEVRNPLAGIKGAIGVIGGRLPPDSRDKAVIRTIGERIDSLNAMVDDLLVFARPRKPAVDRIQMRPILHEAVSIISKDPQLSEVEVRISGPDCDLMGDKEQLKSALFNLLLNAAQSMKGGVVEVEGSCIDEKLRIVIRDQGPGMTEETRARILEPFFTTRSRGTGLGLPIAKRVVDAHGGTLEVQSIEGEGTTVIVDLPLAGPFGGESVREPPPPRVPPSTRSGGDERPAVS